MFMTGNPLYSRYEIGEWSYGNPSVLSWGENSKLAIGKFCSIADEVVIMLGGEHRTDWVTTYPFSAIFADASCFSGHPKSKGDVVIGNDVWIGRHALILSGVEIGDGAVIGAHSVVAKDIPPYAIVVGNPARIIRLRFNVQQVEALRRIAWWNWSLEAIQQAWPLLLSGQIEAFIATYDSTT